MLIDRLKKVFLINAKQLSHASHQVSPVRTVKFALTICVLMAYGVIAYSSWSALADQNFPALLVSVVISAILTLVVILNTRLQHSLHQQLQQNISLYEEIFEHTGTATLLCNAQGQILKANIEAKVLLNMPHNDTAEFKTIQDWMRPLGASSGRYFWQKNTTECQLNANTKCHIELHRSALTNHGHYVLHLQDISHLKAIKAALVTSQEAHTRLALYDDLTQLPNYSHFCDEVNKRITVQKNVAAGAMFIVRISEFKLLNKRFGKEQANKLIVQFAHTFKQKMSDQAIIGRLRGVKFACYIPINRAYFVHRNLSTLIQSILPEQLKLDAKHTLTMQYHIGVTYYPTDGHQAEDLLEHCEMALEYSTHADRISYFNQDLEERLLLDHSLGMQLNQAIKQNNIHIWLQPQVSPDGQIRSFEALARWQLNNGKFIPPNSFIHLAEHLGLLAHLAENLVRELVSMLAIWHDEKIKTPVAFNLAGQELMDDSFFALLMSLSAEHTWLASMLELEITETSPVMTHPLIHKRLRVLSEKGFTIAIDDFGTGQASLGQLIDIPANILKIDRRFIAPLPNDQRHLDIVKSTIQLANSLNMKVIAEGIETKAQADLLIALGCHTLQGYYFGKPTPCVDWTANNHAKAKELRIVY